MDWPSASKLRGHFAFFLHVLQSEQAQFLRLDHWGNAPDFYRFYAVACADFQSHWSCKSFSELQADKQKGIPCSHCHRHICVMTGNFRPHSPFSKSSKAAWAGSLWAAWKMGLSAAAKGLRSFQWAKDSELRIKWTAGLTGSADRRLGSVRKAMQPIDDGNEKIA